MNELLKQARDGLKLSLDYIGDVGRSRHAQRMVRVAIDKIDTALSQPRDAGEGCDRNAVLEEAAKVADNNRLAGGMLEGTKIWAVHEGACIEIAADIRALKIAPPSPSEDKSR